jgi:hypothetical protein
VIERSALAEIHCYTVAPPRGRAFPWTRRSTLKEVCMRHKIWCFEVLALFGIACGDVGPVSQSDLEASQAQLQSESFTYASDMPFMSARNGWGPVERNQSNGDSAAGDGGTMVLDGVSYPKGIGVHADSRVAIDLGGQYTRFEAALGVDDEVGRDGSVVFSVQGDGKPLFQSAVLRGSSAAQKISLDVRGVWRLVLLVGDGGDGIDSDHADWAGASLFKSGAVTPTPTPTPTASWWKPAVGATWAWQLTGTINLNMGVQVYDVDLFSTTAVDVGKIHAGGAHAICYISVGSYEDWRPDSKAFPAEVLGRDYDGWPGEKFLDIRQIDKLAPIMRARLDMCRSKGFDAVEPDNIDTYEANTGFPLTRAHQLAYNRWLANEAHQRGLSIGLKNDSSQASELQPSFDWALTESCFSQGDWCNDLSLFVTAGKPVFMTEYTEAKVDWTGACTRAKTLNFSPILKHLLLDNWAQSCP